MVCQKDTLPADSLAVFHIDTGDAAGQVAHDFIINRTADLSNFFNGNEAVALLAEEDDFITSVDVASPLTSIMHWSMQIVPT